MKAVEFFRSHNAERRFENEIHAGLSQVKRNRRKQPVTYLPSLSILMVHQDVRYMAKTQHLLSAT